MQDKEMDDLFRSQLENFEAEPADNLWPAIDGALHAKRRRAIYVPMLRIAAIILLVISVGWLFIQRQQDQQGGKKQHQVLAVNQGRKKPGPAAQQLTVATIMTDSRPLPGQHKEPVLMPNRRTGISSRVISPGSQPAHAENIVASQKADEVTLADLSPPNEVKPHVVPGQDIPLRINIPDEQGVTPPSGQTLSIAQVPVGSDDQARPAVKRRSKHGLGDLVNLVTDRFNKSRAAIISNDDDDESVIGEVSRGIKKIKKER